MEYYTAHQQKSITVQECVRVETELKTKHFKFYSHLSRFTNYHYVALKQTPKMNRILTKFKMV